MRSPRQQPARTATTGSAIESPMNWLPVMTLPDGTTVEMPMPSPEATGHHPVDGYRVRGSEDVLEFATLTEVIDHLLSSGKVRRAEPRAPNPGRSGTHARA
jgi:hypothetical protein